MQSKDEIYQLLCKLLVEMFEVEPDAIKPAADLYEDLDIDSIDAVDLVVELRGITGKQIDPDAFKAVRTVEDVINAIATIVEVE
jgi:acyl carrier protein